MKTKIVYKNINIFTVCRHFTSNSWTVKSIYRLLSKQWQRRIKNTSCDSILPYFPGNEHFCWLFFFFFCYTHLVQTQWETSEYLSWIYKEMEGLERYTHIFIYTFTYTPCSFILGYNGRKVFCIFLKQHFLLTSYPPNTSWETTGGMRKRIGKMLKLLQQCI